MEKRKASQPQKPHATSRKHSSCTHSASPDHATAHPVQNLVATCVVDNVGDCVCCSRVDVAVVRGAKISPVAPHLASVLRKGEATQRITMLSVGNRT